jgi:hypothetical protein
MSLKSVISYFLSTRCDDVNGLHYAKPLMGLVKFHWKMFKCLKIEYSTPVQVSYTASVVN